MGGWREILNKKPERSGARARAPEGDSAAALRVLPFSSVIRVGPLNLLIPLIFLSCDLTRTDAARLLKAREEAVISSETSSSLPRGAYLKN